MVWGKKGGEKYNLVIALIISLIVIGISLFFIFEEFFTQEDMSQEVCRQSVILRGSPVTQQSIKLVQENIPFKCKTELVEIKFKDKDKAAKLIADKMIECWNIYGEGKLFLYSDQDVPKNKCFFCARIHFSPEIASFYTENNQIPLLPYIRDKKVPEKEVTYAEYLWGDHGITSGGFPAEASFDKFFHENIYYSSGHPNYKKYNVPAFANPAKMGDLMILFVYETSEKEIFTWKNLDVTRLATTQLIGKGPDTAVTVYHMNLNSPKCEAVETIAG